MKTAAFIAVLLLSASLAACTDRDDSATNGNSLGAGGPGTAAGAGGIDQSALNGDTMGANASGAQRQELQVQVGDTVHFGYDSSDVDAEGRTILQRQSQYMQKYPNLTFTIEGHCDQRGTREYNLALGDRRATDVKNDLVALGVSAQRLQVISYGKERPVAVGSTESAWAQNRRAVTVVN